MLSMFRTPPIQHFTVFWPQSILAGSSGVKPKKTMQQHSKELL